jgi:AcrR family transcriptional regulator
VTRSDALRNRARVVEAAESVFAELGPDAGVDAVAARAGVGKATVYRSFPTKEHLFAAVAVQRLRWFEERAEAALEVPDALAGFEQLMVETAAIQARDRVIGGTLAAAAAAEPLELAEAMDRAREALRRVMDRAREAGTLRADATPDDVRVLFGGACRILGEDGERDADVWRRQARLIVAALRS